MSSALAGPEKPAEDLRISLVEPGIGEVIYDLACRIYPICRSITGPGVRETLGALGRHLPIEVREVPTGTAVFDWTIPLEWAIRGAYIRNIAGEKVVDFADNNLHVVGYSRPVRTVLPLAELKRHIHTLPEQPDLIPYRTAYYSEQWGFCMTHRQLEALSDGFYEVVVDTSLDRGSLSYGEYLHRGETDEEFLFSAHICHPSLANDNCSGLALLAVLAERLSRLRTRYSYRFLFAPGTIGAIAWLAINETGVERIRHGLVVSCLGDGGGPTYKKSRRGNAAIDRVMSHVLRHAAGQSKILDFFPYGYDERQYCSPGFNLPVGLFQRSRFGTFPEYHTSADDLNFIRPEHLADSYRMIAAAIEIVERDWLPLNVAPKCEPQLGRRGLYDAVGGGSDGPVRSMAFLWILNLADGAHSLFDVAERADLPFAVVADAAALLRERGLLAGNGSGRCRNIESRDLRQVHPLNCQH
jgi:aminopeptidase-like protein